MGFVKEDALLERFTAGLSALASQIELKNRIRYLDANITAEQFVCRLMNILYDADYQSGNDTHGLTAGYDLIWEQKREIIQVSSSCTGDKIDDANLKTRRAIREGKLEPGAYTLRFAFLANDASKLKTCAAAERAKRELDFSFDPEADILDFTTFAARVKTRFQFVPERADRLRAFMDYCSDVFPADGKEAAPPPPADRVQRIIDEYAGNFEEPLFMHLYADPPVRLMDLYVDPAFLRYGYPRRDMASCVEEFIGNEAYKRERFFFIEGSAAIGKTSLVSWLCWHYRNQTETGKSMFGSRRLVCIRLRELDFQDAAKAEDVLLRYLNIPDTEAFERRYPDAVVILDGADELSMVSSIPHGSVEEFLLELQRKFRSHKFLITTRPKFLDMKKFSTMVYQYRLIVLRHYNAQLRCEWLDRYKACGQSIPENTERYIRTLQGQDENGVADTPLALYLLAQCDAESDLLGNQWALFRRIFSEAIVRGEYNANFSESSALMDQRSSTINYRVVQSIAYRIFRNASQERHYLNEQEIMEAISECDLEDLSPKRVRETCVLCAYWKNVGSIGALEFYHNNIRDFFLCEYLCRKLIEELRDPEPLEKLVPMLCRVLCHADICRSTWKQVYEYLCLRLDYESVKPPTEDSLYHLLQEKQKILTCILPRLVAGRELWNADHDPHIYRGAKQTFRNIHMLVRLLQSFCPERIKLTSGGVFATDREAMELLKDWNSAFYNDPVRYTDHTGKDRCIDASSDTEYQYLSLSGHRIDGISFDGCSMLWSELNHAVLNNVSFREASLRNVDLGNSILLHNQFDKTTILNVEVPDTAIINSFFHSAYLEEIHGAVSMKQSWIYPETKIVRSGLERSHFQDVNIQGMTVKKSRLKLAVFEKVQLRNCVIRDTDLSETNFDGTLTGVTFEKCQFSCARFKRPDTFRDVTFRNCSFPYVTFRGMDLSGVTFEDCDFQYADIPQLGEQ